jgi:hypothetical protein
MAASFALRWTLEADAQYKALKAQAEATVRAREKSHKTKATKAEGLFKQVHKTLEPLKSNPRHSGLHTHEYRSLSHPWDPQQPVFEAYAQHKTPGAYRVFWCYGPRKGELTIIAITKQP